MSLTTIKRRARFQNEAKERGHGQQPKTRTENVIVSLIL